MGSTTPATGLPYPVGSDRVMDGDNAIQALAERVEARYPRGLVSLKSVAVSHQFGNGEVFPEMATAVQLFAGRWYRATFVSLAQMNTSNGRFSVSIMLSGVAIKVWQEDLSTGAFAGVTLSAVFQTTTGVNNLNIWGACSAGATVNLSGPADNPVQFAIEDLGGTS